MNNVPAHGSISSRDKAERDLEKRSGVKMWSAVSAAKVRKAVQGHLRSAEVRRGNI